MKFLLQIRCIYFIHTLLCFPQQTLAYWLNLIFQFKYQKKNKQAETSQNLKTLFQSSWTSLKLYFISVRQASFSHVFRYGHTNYLQSVNQIVFHTLLTLHRILSSWSAPFASSTCFPSPPSSVLSPKIPSDLSWMLPLCLPETAHVPLKHLPFFFF